MPSLNLTITGDKAGAEIIKKALAEVKLKANEVNQALASIKTSKVVPPGLSKLEAELKRTKSEVKELTAALKVETLSISKLEAEVVKLTAKNKLLTGSTNKQTAASKSQVASNSILRDSTRGVAGALGGLWFAYGQVLPLMAAFAVASSFKKGVTEGAEFARQMQFVKGVTNESVEAITSASSAILSLGESNLRGPVELAQGMRVLTKAGLDLESALTGIAPVTALSVVGELEMAKATKIATSTMNAFGKTAKDLPNIVDVIGKASIISATEVGDLGNALSFMTGVTKLLNAELPEMAAQLAVAAQNGVTGSKAGTALNRAWLNLAAQAPKTTRALKELDVDVFDEGKLRSMEDVLSEILGGLSRFNKEAQSVLIKDIFGVRSIKAIVPVIAEADGKMVKFREEIASASDGIGTMNRFLNDLKDNLSGALQGALSSLSVALIEGFRSAEPVFTSAAVALDKMFRTTEFKTFVSGLLKSLATATKFIIDHKEQIILLGKAYLAFQLGGIISAPVVSGITALMGAQGLAGLAVGATGAAASLGTLTTAALALIGPAGWLALATGAMIAFLWQINKLKEAKRSQFEIFSEGFGSTLANTLDRVKNKAQTLREEIEKLRGIDPSASKLAGFEDQLGQLVLARELMQKKLDELSTVSGPISVNKTIEQVRIDQDAGGINKVREDIELADKKIDELVSGIKELKAELLTVGGLELAKGAVQKETAAQLAEQEASAAIPEGTQSVVRINITDLKTEFNEALAIIDSNLARERKILDAHHRSKIVTEEAFVTDRATLATEAENARLTKIKEFRALSLNASAEGEAGELEVQKFVNSLKVKEEQVKNQAILDERLALIAALGASVKDFDASIKSSDTSIASSLQSIAKSEATDFFGNINTEELAESKIALLEADISKRLALVQAETAGEKATKAELDAFNAKQTEAELKLHEELQKGKTAITLEEAAKQRAATVQNFQDALDGGADLLGALGDLSGEESEKSFERSKRFKIAQAVMNMASGIAGAIADTDGNIVSRIAAGATAAVAGLAQIKEIRAQTFSGQAHDGLVEVPSTGTFLLEKGERVVKKEDNKQLQNFLNTVGIGGGPAVAAAPVVQFSVSAIDGESVKTFLARNEQKIVDMVQNAYDRRLVTGGPKR